MEQSPWHMALEFLAMYGCSYHQPMDIAVYMYVCIVETFLFSLSPIGHAHVKSIVLCVFWLLERGFPETWFYSLSFKLIFNDYFKISCHLRFFNLTQAVSHLWPKSILANSQSIKSGPLIVLYFIFASICQGVMCCKGWLKKEVTPRWNFKVCMLQEGPASEELNWTLNCHTKACLLTVTQSAFSGDKVPNLIYMPL